MRETIGCLDDLWRIKCIEQCYIYNEQLPRVCSRWRDYYIMHYFIHQQRYFFQSGRDQIQFPQEPFDDFGYRTRGKILRKRHYTRTFIPKYTSTDRDYIFVVPSDSRDVMFIHDNVLWYIEYLYRNESSLSARFSTEIKGVDLSRPFDPPILLGSGMAPLVNLFHNGSGTLGSCDNRGRIVLWHLKTRKQILELIISYKQVSLLCLYQEMIVIGNTLFTSIWNLETGRLLSVFRNPPELRLVLESNQNVRVVFHNPTLVIAAQEGQHFVFSVGQDNQMEYVQHVTDPEIANHGFSYSPMALICGTHYFIANGGFPDELSVYLLERQTPYFMNSQVHIHPELVLSKFNSFSVFEHVTEPTRSTNTVMGIMYPLSEAKAAERYHLSILPIRDLKSAYQDPDGSTIAACSHHTTDDFEQSLYVWDFRYERRRPRYFEKFHLAEKIVFICFESSPTWLE